MVTQWTLYGHLVTMTMIATMTTAMAVAAAAAAAAATAAVTAAAATVVVAVAEAWTKPRATTRTRRPALLQFQRKKTTFQLSGRTLPEKQTNSNKQSCKLSCAA